MTRGAVLLVPLLGGCGWFDGSDGGAGSQSAATYVVSGTVVGLNGSGLVLRNNFGDDLAVPSNGTFAFHAALSDGSTYAVTVFVQPTANPTQTCSLVNGAGTINGADVTDVTVTCRTPWTKQHGTGGDDYATGVAMDVYGNIFVTGYTDGTLDGNVSAGGQDAFLVKYDSSGVMLWARQFGTTSGDFAEAVATDPAGNVVVGGETYGSLGGGTNAGWTDAFLAKYDADGNQLWLRQLGTAEFDFAKGIGTDADGNIYVAGEAGTELTGAGDACDSCLFLAKFGPDGDQLWVQQNPYLGANGVATDSQGNVYVVGNSYFNLSGNSLFTLDIVLTKYTPDGAAQWVKFVGSDWIEDAFGIATGPGNTVYVAGYTTGNLGGAGNAGGHDIVVAKFGPGGDRQWVRQFGSAWSEDGVAVAAGGAGDVYVTGWTAGNLDGNSNAGARPGDTDIFITKYDADGNRVWTREIGVYGNDGGVGVVTDAAANVYVAGNTSGGFDGQDRFGGDDYVLVKYDGGSGQKQ